MHKVVRVCFSRQANMPLHAATREQHRDAREYDYFFVPLGTTEVKEGDFAIVPVNCRNQGHETMKVVEVVGVLNRSTRATKYAIATFSLEGHREALKRQKEIARLREDIEARAAEAARRKSLEDMAGEDEMLKGLLAKLQELENQT